MNDLIRYSKLTMTVPVILLGLLFWLSYAVLQEFFIIVAWAVIIAYVMWPLYRRLRKTLKNRSNLSAAVMTGFISALVFAILFGLVNLLQREILNLYQALVSSVWLTSGEVPESIKRIPWLSDYVQVYLDQFNSAEAGVKTQIVDWAKNSLGELAKFLGNIGRNMMSLGFILVTLFFCFRDGQQVIAQLNHGLVRYLGQHQKTYFKAAGDTAQAVVYGIVLAAIGQGLIAGIGYLFAGAKAPVLFGVLTAVFALVPMGATLIWVPVSMSLVIAGDYWQGAGLMLWGIFAVSTVDNIIRPIVISGAGRIPFLVVMFGVFGGLQAFGFVGLFLGPIVLSVLLAVWQAWLKRSPIETDMDAL